VRQLEKGQWPVGHTSPIKSVTEASSQGQKYIVKLEDDTEIPLDSDDGLDILNRPPLAEAA